MIKNNTISKIAVIGLGLMGRDISVSIADNGYDVIAVSHKNRVNEVKNCIINIVNKKKNFVHSVDYILNKITIIDYSSISSISESDLIIECVPEIIEIKKEVMSLVFKQNLKDSTVVASNSSGISVKDFCPFDKLKRTLGIHFMSPAYKIKLVEVVKNEFVSIDVLNKVQNFLVHLGRKPVIVRDTCGFVASRLLAAMINEALTIYRTGIAGVKDIDTVATEGLNFPIGPFEISDKMGIETVHNSLKNMSKICPAFSNENLSLLKTMIELKKLGKKSKEGFYKYE